MNQPQYRKHSPLTEEAADLGKQAMELGRIPSFVVRYFPDSSQFYIPDENNSEPLTPEEAYMRFKKLIEQVTHP